jgi:hypothetical protein
MDQFIVSEYDQIEALENAWIYSKIILNDPKLLHKIIELRAANALSPFHNRF